MGCGNGAVAQLLSQEGYKVTGIDPSTEGIQQGNNNFPNLDLHAGSSEDDLLDKYGTFPLVISLEVIEHIYNPYQFAQKIFDLLEPGGAALLSTPYHGFLKNLGLSLTNKWDGHFTALWENGHIKFWSVRTLTELMRQTGFTEVEIHFAGRIKWLSKSMIVVVKRPK